MKFQWEPADIKPGTVVRSTTTNATNALCMIGYTVFPEKKFVLWSLADGQRIFSADDEESMALSLGQGYKPYPVKFVPFDNNRFEDIR